MYIINMINTYILYTGNTKCWYKNNELNRDGDLPAIKWFYGSNSWYKNGEYHRDNDLPAVEWTNGNKWWYKNDIRYFPIEQYIIIESIIIKIKIKIMKMGNKWWYTCHN